MTPNVTIDLSGRNGDPARLRHPKERDAGVVTRALGPCASHPCGTWRLSPV